MSQLHYWPQDFKTVHIMCLITVSYYHSTNTQKGKKCKITHQNVSMLEISFKTADTELHIYETLPDTLRLCLLGFHTASLRMLLRGPCWLSSSTGPLNVGISWLGSGYFSFFFYTHSLCAQAHGWFLFLSQLCEPFFAPLSLPVRHWFPLGSQPSRCVLWNPL